MTFHELCEQVNGAVLQTYDPALNIYYLLTDSRQAIIQRESVFFAIKGKRHDGHHFIKELYDKGCRQFVLEKEPESELSEANIIKVGNSVEALQQVVAFHRKLFSIPVIGISGSNGKTIVKEWLSQILTHKHNVVKNPKSYNSQIGVPLSVWQLNQVHEIGVFEAGISMSGEMEKLQKVICPSLGIFTNLGPAHDKGFTNRRQKAVEKAKLFSDCEYIIYREEYALIADVLKSQHSPDHLYSWSTQNTEADLWVAFSMDSNKPTIIEVKDNGREQGFRFTFDLKDAASLENVMHCIAVLIKYGWAENEIQAGIDQLRQVNMRMELKEGINQCFILDDSYSNDLAGLKIALDYLERQTQNQKNTVIISDLLQSGYYDRDLYAEVVKLLENHSIQKVELIGPGLKSYLSHFRSSAWVFEHYNTTEEFLSSFQPKSFQGENILVKGARAFGFERIVKKLQKKITGTTLEINLDNIIHNLNYHRSLLRPETRMMVMVKAFSYGGASFEIANLLQYHRVAYLAVAYVDEGVMLREHGINTPILVLNPSADAFPLMQEFQLEAEIYSFRLLNAYSLYCKNNQAAIPIHLKIDTGMHRLGFVQEETEALKTFFNANPEIIVKSIFSHLVASEDDQEDAFTQQQVHEFGQVYDQLISVLGYAPIKHILNSGGIQRFPEYQFDMVRLGIGLYGVDVSSKAQDQLRPISTLKTIISQIKSLKVGETVGYNRKGKIENPKRIATIAIGYADGLDRRLGNGNLRVFVNGFQAPTIGNICMDMTMIDITGIEAEEGDVVTIFGQEQSVSVLAEAMHTIPYEVLTSISARVKRIFYSEL
ncbi:alanine racemase [Catalinimonas alkaloidigena]|uniref:bifunctional UDP-N-acetylmuramoyl-tripeptide:D-alanyl-D-alanine ligase/alanine racemase n=1 Tax=Catalinimonas alkaloidigena TaxID=1075417 RepID=UPI002405A5E4|nr:bifunctional UDP-N-acetylmuramoyl-tripeptide:D-alanyl-D-alanine ligase/alanine racemase [Catalinimonas alkaloidigena]MDF9796892.1 alanine racemase [Catalinimonas alkaloidigena]